MRHCEIPDDHDDDFMKLQYHSDTELNVNKVDPSKERKNISSTAHGRELKKFEAHLNYFKKVFGSQFDSGRLDSDVLHLLDDANIFGPEQVAVYARESAHSAAGCCTYGCCDERVKAMDIDKLSSLEREVALRAEQSYDYLKNFQTVYVKKLVDTDYDGAHIHHSNHTRSEELNLKRETHRLSRLIKQKQKIFPPQIDIPKSDEENLVKVGP